MSKSVKRVLRALESAGVACEMREAAAPTRTAAEAAAVAGVELDRIAKSILLQGAESGRLYLFLTAGGRSVATGRAEALAGEGLGRAEAATVRAVTGFAIGGVAPIGHLTAPPAWLDRRLMDFATVWAAGGTPRHIFEIPPHILQRLTGAAVADFTTLPM